MISCPNCDTSYSGNYCPNCGQKDINLERPTVELASEIVKETFEVDGRAVQTLKMLFLPLLNHNVVVYLLMGNKLSCNITNLL